MFSCRIKHLAGMITIVLLICFLEGCAPVQQKELAGLPPVEPLEESSQKQEEFFKESPSKIDTEKIDSTVSKKTYQGIEGEFMETPLLKDCHFEFDRYDITPEARKILADNANILKKMPKSIIQIEGHCDERGTKEYNLALGERRAASVKNYLTSLGVPDGILSTISYGEEMPIDDRSNEEAWSKNRRAHFIILTKN
ncbi:MAG: peptidoglycan-associated lipoprotein Pal [bacterium]